MNESVIILSQVNPPVLPWYLNLGMDFIKTIQGFENSALTLFMKAVSAAGTEFFYMAAVLLVFWCLNEKNGFRLGMIVILSAWVNAFFKILFNQQRPFEIDPSVGLAFESSRAFPSGHAQNSMAFWASAVFYLSFRLKSEKVKKYRPLIIALASLFVLMIGFSRLYLGVHFPTDVLGGWAFAIFVIILFYFLEKPLAVFFVRNGKRIQLVFAAAAALLLNMLLPGDKSFSAMLLGFCTGYSLMSNGFPFTADRNDGPGYSVFKLTLRYIIGIIGAVVIYAGLLLIFPGKDSIFKNIAFLEPYYELGRFIRYGLLGLWASAGAPKLFQNWNLAASGIVENPKE